MKILFACGGSIGHVAPAVAVWRALSEKHPGAAAVFVCANREDEKEFLAKEMLRFQTLPVPRLGFPFLWKFPQGFFGSFSILKQEKPDAVLSKGGAMSVPLSLAAWVKGIPVVLHESDAVMGTANRMIARIARHVCLGTGEPRSAKEVMTGNPVRPLMREGKKEEGRRITGLSGAKPVLMVNGGSQGAKTLNEWVAANIGRLLPVCDIIHITGRGKRGADKRDGYFCAEFVTSELPHLYACSSLALTRAGAGTIGELAATGTPAILVPLPGLAHDHQTKNAVQAAASGGCMVMQQDDLPGHLFPLLTSILADHGKQAEMSARIRTLDRPAAALQIAEVIAACLAPAGADA